LEETGESQEQKYEPYQHGLKPGTDTKRFTAPETLLERKDSERNRIPE
jgi:hypothetical protein